MKQTVKTSRAAGQLEKMFRALNNRFFDGQLQEPVISLKKTPGAYGHITCAKTWTAGTEQRHEINISTAYLDRPIEDTAATLLHEMCHLYAIMNGITDCSANGMYHNKKFKAIAEAHGLEVEHHQQYGWTITSPGFELLEFIELQGWQPIQMTEGISWADMTGTGTGSRTPGAAEGGAPRPPKRPTSTRKYYCPKCGNSCRATKTINIICGDCTEQMIIAD
jgi:hypothetical protein